MILFDLKRASVNDGTGMRTVVFFKGCPLKCEWCHNPESQSVRPQIGFLQELCIQCRSCEICPVSCNEFTENGHTVSDDRCNGCGACVKACPKSALILYGYEATVESVMQEIEKDVPYFRYSGGGVTFSGGEPMAQFPQALALAQAVKSAGISLYIETSGFGKKQDFLDIAKFTDCFLFDIKTVPSLYERYTGVRSEKIFENLMSLDGAGAKIVLRCPIIPKVNLNEEHFEFLAKLSKKLKNLQKIDLLPYHPTGLDKYRRLGMVAEYKNASFLEKTELTAFAKILKEHTGISVSIG